MIGRANVAMAKRDVRAHAFRPAHRNTDELRANWILDVHHGIQCEAASVADGADDSPEALGAGDRVVMRLAWGSRLAFGSRAELSEEARELELAENRSKRGSVPSTESASHQLLIDRHVVAKGHELAGGQRVLAVHRELFLQRFALDAVEVLVDAIEASVVLEELGCRLLPHRGHARHVVGAVAHQREQVAYLIRLDAELLTGLLGAEYLVSHRVVHDDVRADELEQVLVGADDHDSEPLFAGLRHQCRDDVIRLQAGRLDR